MQNLDLLREPTLWTKGQTNSVIRDRQVKKLAVSSSGTLVLFGRKRGGSYDMAGLAPR